MKKVFYLLVGWGLLKSLPVLAVDNFSTTSLVNQTATKLNPGGLTNISLLMSRGVNAMVVFMGTIALALIVYAGFMWMTAGGNESKIEKARTIMIWTLLGTIAIGASYGFVKFIIGIFG